MWSSSESEESGNCWVSAVAGNESVNRKRELSVSVPRAHDSRNVNLNNNISVIWFGVTKLLDNFLNHPVLWVQEGYVCYFIFNAGRLYTLLTIFRSTALIVMVCLLIWQLSSVCGLFLWWPTVIMRSLYSPSTYISVNLHFLLLSAWITDSGR